MWCPRVVPWSRCRVLHLLVGLPSQVSSVLADVGKTHLQSVAKHAKKVEWGEHYIYYIYTSFSASERF